MKSLNLSQPLVMLVIGMPGAGKSFFAKRFSETFGAPVVSFDRLRYELFPEPQHTPEETELINRLADYQIDELTKTKKTFIVDGGSNAKTERTRISQLVKNAGYEVLVVWVQTHQGTAQTRATKRSARREDDKYNPSLTPEQFEAHVRRLTAPNRENYVVISGMHTYGTQAKAVLRRLVADRQAEAEAIHKTEARNTQHPQRPGSQRRNLIIR